MNYLRALATLVLSLLTSALFAQALPVPRVVYPSTTVGNTINIGPLTANAANAANFSFGAAANGAVFANSTGYVPTAGGSSIPISVAGQIAKPSVRAALGRFIARGMPLLNTGVALYDLAKELGYDASSSSTGAVSFSQNTDTSTYQIICQAGDIQGTMSSLAQRCTDALTTYWRNGEYPTCSYALTVNATSFSMGYNGVQCGGYPTLSPSRLTNTTGPNPATAEQFLTSVDARPSWPPSSALGPAVRDAVKSGQEVAVEPQAVTGPASQPVSQLTAVDPARNTSTQTTTVQNYNYGPSSVTVTNVTTNITTDRATGVQTDNGTKTDVVKQPETLPPVPAEKVVVCGLPDTPACKIDETGTKPDAGDTYTQPKTELETAKTSATSAIADAANIATPAWSFTFQLPTGCAPYVTGIKGVILNVCQYQPVMHSLLSAIWAAATVFCMIGMVGRTIRES